MPLLKTEQAALSADEAKSIAVDAYVYGYSLITTEVTRVQMQRAQNRRATRSDGTVHQRSQVSASRVSWRIGSEC